MNLAETFESQGLFSITILRRGPNFGNKWLVKVHKSEKNWLISDEEAKKKGKLIEVIHENLYVAMNEALGVKNMEDMI